MRLKHSYAVFVAKSLPHNGGSQGMSGLTMKVTNCSAVYARRHFRTGVIMRDTSITTMHGLRPHACVKCNARYAYKSSLLRHTMRCGQKQAREPDPVFKCDICQRRFARKDGLQDHINGKHKGIARYTCPHCKTCFQWRSSCNRHLKSHCLKK